MDSKILNGLNTVKIFIMYVQMTSCMFITQAFTFIIREGQKIKHTGPSFVYVMKIICSSTASKSQMLQLEPDNNDYFRLQ